MRMKAWDQCGTAIEAALLHAELKVTLASLLTGMEERIAAGVHGRCLNCSASISPERLRALPWAQFCATCEDARGALHSGMTSATHARATEAFPFPPIPDSWRKKR